MVLLVLLDNRTLEPREVWEASRSGSLFPVQRPANAALWVLANLRDSPAGYGQGQALTLEDVDARHNAGHDESGRGLSAKSLRELGEERHAGVELLHRNVLIGRMG